MEVIKQVCAVGVTGGPAAHFCPGAPQELNPSMISTPPDNSDNNNNERIFLRCSVSGHDTDQVR